MFSAIKKAIEAVLNYRYIVPIGTALFFCMSGMAILLVVLNANLMRDQMDRDFNQQQLIMARQAARTIGVVLNRLGNDIDNIARLIESGADDQEVAQVAAMISENNIEYGLVDIGLFTGAEQATCFLDLDGGGLLTPELLGETVEECLGDTFIAKMNIVSERDGTAPCVATVFARRLRTGDSREAVLCGRLDITRLLRTLTGDIRSGKTGGAWVVNENGTYLYHPESRLIGRNAFVARRRQDPDLSFAQINEIMRKRMLRGEEGAGKYEIAETGAGVSDENLVAFAPVARHSLMPCGPWSVAVEAPLREVEAAAKAIYWNHIAAETAIIAGLLLFGLTATAYHHRISRELKKKVSLQEEYISGILKSSKDAIVFIDNANRVQVWNKGAEATFGYTADEMLGQTFHKLIPPDIDADQELLQIKKRVMCEGHIRNYRAARLTRDGRRITIDLSRSAVYSKSGDMIGSIAIIKDITETTELEQRIYNTEKLASIGILAAGVAHEINNPLGVILGFADLIKEKLHPGTPEYNDLKTIEDNANYAKRVVENMLGFARVTEGQRDKFNVSEVVHKVIDVVKNSLALRKIELHTELQENIPELDGDPREIQQVIFNLVNNSMAAMPESGGRLAILAQADKCGVTLRVEDNGSGIPDRIKDLVFDPFYTTKNVGEGTGLGLSLCYGIVKKYGGRLSFTSRSAEDYPGGPTGTIFEVSIPACGGGKENGYGTENTRA